MTKDLTRLFRPRHGLRAVLAKLWRPGLEVYDRLTNEDFVVVCAWCRRLRSNDGRWVVSEELARLVASGGVSHGICEACEKELEV